MLSNQLYHWSPIRHEYIYKQNNVLDCPIGSDGIAAYTNGRNEMFIGSSYNSLW